MCCSKIDHGRCPWAWYRVLPAMGYNALDWIDGCCERALRESLALVEIQDSLPITEWTANAILYLRLSLLHRRPRSKLSKGKVCGTTWSYQ